MILNVFTLDWGSKEYIKQGSVGWLWFTKVSFNINNNSNNDSNILGLPWKDVHVLLFKVFIKQQLTVILNYSWKYNVELLWQDKKNNYLLTTEVLYLQCNKQSSYLFFFGSNLSSEAQDLIAQLLKKV